MADVNELIGGYKLRTMLQTGQTSQVFEVVEPHSNRHFAMKLLLPEAAANSEQRSILFHEAEVGIKLTHQNVIRIVKVNRSRETPHFIMEFFPSGSLRLRLQAKDMKFIRDNSRKIFKEAATGLAYMNATGYIHRDVKPDNILVNSLGDTKIIDFAITRKYPKGLAALFYRRRRPQGTPSYMSPEQIRDEILDGRADIYSYGCTLFELTTGRKPFVASSQQDLLSKHFAEKAAPPHSYNKDLTEDFSAFVLKMLAKQKKDRFESFHEVLIALQKIKIWKDEKLEQDPDAGFGQVTRKEPVPTPPAPAPVNKQSVQEPEPSHVDEQPKLAEGDDTICLRCKHRWKRDRKAGSKIVCVKCGAGREHLRALKQSATTSPTDQPPPQQVAPAPNPTPVLNPDDIDIDAL